MRWSQWALRGVIVAVSIWLLMAPLLGLVGPSGLTDLWFVAFSVVLALSWNILGGLAGQVSFGYSAFLGLGAYTTMILSRAGWNPYLTLPLGGLIAAAFSVLVGLPTFRLRGPYFSIATIGVSEAMRVLMSAMEWTGGSSGLRMPPEVRPGLLETYYSILALALVMVAVHWLIQRSKFGLGLTAIKQDIDAAEALGVNATRYKLLAHGVGAAAVGVAGGLYTLRILFIVPLSVFDFKMSLSMVLMPVIGGVGTLVGPIIGGVTFGYIQQKLLVQFPTAHLLTYGLLLIVVMMFEPAGIVGMARRAARWLRRLAGTGSGAIAGGSGATAQGGASHG